MINLDKCALLWPRGSDIPHVVSGLAQARGLPIQVGSLEVLGAPVGVITHSDPFFKRILQSHRAFFDELLRADLSVQVAMLLLRVSSVPSLGAYYCPPCVHSHCA